MARIQRQPFIFEGDLADLPLAHLLVSAERERFRGSIVLGPPQGSFFDRAEKRLHIEDGITVAADLGEQQAKDLSADHSGQSLFSCLIRLCGQPQGRFHCLPDRDLVGTGRAVLRGYVDPWTLLASSLRSGSARTDAIDGALLSVSTGYLQMRHGCEYERLGLTKSEWNFVQLVRRRGGALDDLLAESPVPAAEARALLYLLLQTGMLVRLPGSRQLESRTLSIPAEVAADANGPEFPEEQTLVCDLAALPFDLPVGDTEEPTSTAPKPISLFPGMDSDGSGFEGSRLFRLSSLALSRGHVEEAFARVEQALHHSPADPRFLGLKARVLLEQASDSEHVPEEVLSLAREALALDTECELAHEVMGRLCKAEGRQEEAQRHFRAAALRNPANLYAVQEVLNFDPTSSPDRPSFWQRLRRSIPPFRSAG